MPKKNKIKGREACKSELLSQYLQAKPYQNLAWSTPELESNLPGGPKVGKYKRNIEEWRRKKKKQKEQLSEREEGGKGKRMTGCNSQAKVAIAPF